MATVTGLTAERMRAIEDASVIDGEVIADHLILTKHDGTTIDAGSIVGPQGPQGPTGSSMFLGAVVDWPWESGSIPAGTELPYGQQLAAAEYPALQAIADASGVPYGGSVGVNFRMPDYRGRIGVGKDNMGSVAANRITASISGVSGSTLGGVFGAEGITLTTAQLPAHNHYISGSPGITDGQHQHLVPVAAGGQTSGNAGSNVNNASSSIYTNYSTSNVSANAGSLSGSSQGSGSSHQNTQPSIIVNKIMRVT